MSIERDNSVPALALPKRSITHSQSRVTVHIKKESRSLRPYATVLFIHIVCYSIIIISVPSLLLYLYDGDTASASLFYGYLSGGSSFLFIFTRPWYGYMADRYGRRPFMFVFNIGLISAMAGIVIGQNFTSLIAAAIIRGITDCSVPIIPSVIGDVIGDDDLMGRRFGQLGAAMGLGAIVGPALSFACTYVSSDRRLPFIVAVVLGIINGILTLTWVKETNENRGTKSPFRKNSDGALQSVGNRVNPFKVFKVFKESPYSFFLALSLMFINISFTGLLVVMFLYTHYRYNWNDRQNGMFLLLFGFLASITQVTVLPLALPKHRWGLKVTAYVGTVSYFVGMILIGLSWIDWFLYVIACIASLGFIMSPALRGAMSEGLEANRQGEMQGASAFLDSIAEVGGPFALSAVFSFFISHQSPLKDPLPGAPFFVGAVLQLLATVWMTVAFGCCAHTKKELPLDEIPQEICSIPSPTPRTGSILRADEQKEVNEPSKSKSKSMKSVRKSKKGATRGMHGEREDGKVTLELNVLRSPLAPKVAVHPDPDSDSPLNSRGVSPEPVRTLPRVHMGDSGTGPRGSDDSPLKIHENNEDTQSQISGAVELSSLDHKHTPARKISRDRMMVGGPGIPYDTNSYSSSNQIAIDRVLNESLEAPPYGGPMTPPYDSDEERKLRAYGSNSTQNLMLPVGDRYIAVRTSSMDERELEHEQSKSKLKIHFSEDDNEDQRYRVNHG